MKTDVEDKVIVLEAEPHDIMDIPAASLWELCRRFDAEMGKSLKGINSGLCVFEYFKGLTEDAARGGHVHTEDNAIMDVTLEAFREVVTQCVNAERSAKEMGATI